MFTPWEKATQVQDSAQPGLLPASTALPLTILFTVVLLLILYPVMGATSIPVSLAFARMAALDLTSYTLPNIYTLPLLAVGMAHAATHGNLKQALVAALILALLNWVVIKARPTAGAGGGDFKLLAAYFAFFPAFLAFPALAIGCLLWLPVAAFAPRRQVPFGLPILLAFTLLLWAPGFPWQFLSFAP